MVSHEVLAAATSEQISRALASLAPADVHVVYGARDLARQLPAVWQESLKNRRTRPYRQFLDDRAQATSPAAARRRLLGGAGPAHASSGDGLSRCLLTGST
ncbi:MAG: hypothetical protein WKF76_03465 [Nocardioidaceae bacterium]